MVEIDQAYSVGGCHRVDSMNWEDVKNMLLSAKSDYAQLFEKDRPIAQDANLLMQKLSRNVPSNADFRNPQAMSQWSQAAALNAPMGLMFTGPKSTGWNKDLAKKAQKMLDSGVPADKVWEKTMYGRMPDNSMFTEIDDSGAKLRFPEDFKQAIIEKKEAANNISEIIKSLKETKKIQNDLFQKDLNGGITQLSNKKKEILNDVTRNYGLEWGANGFTGARLKYALDHGELPGAYPSLSEDVVVRLEPSIDNSLRGSYSDSKLNIYTKNSKEKNFNPTSTALHETQHAIQDYEGWGSGGNPSMFEGDAKTKMEQYRRLVGEAQARSTQDRFKMTMDERRRSYPLANDMLSDIPLNKLIYRYE